MKQLLAIILLVCGSAATLAQGPQDTSATKLPNDSRLGPARTLYGDFPFTPVGSAEEWRGRAEHLRRQVLLSAGLWPMPEKTSLNVVIHGPVERDDYIVEKVFFESLPGHFVTGSLYRPKTSAVGQKLPGVLCPHGHWPNGRFYVQGDKLARSELSIGAERWENAARYPWQARCVQLARMGCVVFDYDMIGYADSVQFAEHRPTAPFAPPQPDIGPHQFYSAAADARLQTLFGLQTWNSVRALDFLLSLPQVDSQRIGVTGASGGGTQTMILTAIDDRVTAAFPCVMVSTSMQGGCPCENGHYLRVGMGNIDIAALTAPRPLGLTAANDWTKDLRTKGYPDLQRLYAMVGHPERLTATFNIHFKHNYNHVSRCSMYGFFNQHFRLGFDEPVLERDFDPLSVNEMSVWNADHLKPSGDSVGAAHEKALRDWFTADMNAQLSKVISPEQVDLKELHRIVGTAWGLMIGRKLPDETDLDFKLLDEVDHGSYLRIKGLVRYKPSREELSALFLYPTDWNGEIVLWVTPDGKSGIMDSAGQPISPIRRLLAAKHAVCAADLFGQGDFAVDGKPLEQNKMTVMLDGKETWQHYSGYTFGYNPPLFVQRVRDLMTMVAFVRSNSERHPTRVSVVGLAGTGPWVAAARARTGNAIDHAAVDTNGFRFQSIETQSHVDFVPGAVKYGDLPVLLALSAPHRLHIFEQDADSIGLVRAAFHASKSEQMLIVGEQGDSFPDAAIEGILSNAR